MRQNKAVSFLRDTLPFRGIDIEASNEYLNLCEKANARFSKLLSLYEDEIDKFGEMLRYSSDGGKTFRKYFFFKGGNTHIHINFEGVDLENLYSSSDDGLTYKKDEKTTTNCIEKINEALDKRAEFLRKNTIAEFPYEATLGYDVGKNDLYSEKTFPFTDIRSKEGIERIQRNTRIKKFKAFRDCVLIICGLLGSIASIVSLYFYFRQTNP
jgi:hypothetical protein